MTEDPNKKPPETTNAISDFQQRAEKKLGEVRERVSEGRNKPKGFARVRPYPKYARVDAQSDTHVKFSIPAMHRLWARYFKLLVVPVLLAYCALVFYITMVEGYYEYGSLITWIVIGLAAAAVVYFTQVRVRMTVEATPDYVAVQGLKFRPDHYGGITNAFEFKSGKTNRPQFSPTGQSLTMLRINYGSWGEWTDFIVETAFAPEYIIWMNHMVDPVIGRNQPETPTETGIREQKF
ncbi:hypothetical protein [Henriciella sp.]|uniref:hypothetical protein n=1 Tax=Henriciella sp. TaxID=1968823 RepID=UPI002637B37A|nr:hypothetical protein [Henriciella sp.]